MSVRPGRLREELAKLRVEINEEKSRMVDLAKGGTFSFLGFEYRRILGRSGKWRPNHAPKQKKRTALLAKLREVFRHNVSQPVGWVIAQINPISMQRSFIPRRTRAAQTTS
jgi:RNA-directed DNA polymerase